MPSVLKSETARINGAKSHGPVTPEGKARSSANSRRHGLAGASILIEGESNEDFDNLRADFLNRFQPQNAVETDLVDAMVIARWRLRRLLAIEAHLFDLETLYRKDDIKSRSKQRAMQQEDRMAFIFQKLGDEGKSLSLVLRYEATLNRSYSNALKQLLQLQSTRPPAPPKAPLGSFRNSETPSSYEIPARTDTPKGPSASPFREIEAPNLQPPPDVSASPSMPFASQSQVFSSCRSASSEAIRADSPPRPALQ
jgi:hypothetical protein